LGAFGDDDDDVVESCALVTVPANRLLAEIDNTTGQMPAILRREDYDTCSARRWPMRAGSLITHPQTRMVSHPVAPYVNHLEFDEPRLIGRHPEGQFSRVYAAAESRRIMSRWGHRVSRRDTVLGNQPRCVI